MLYEEAERQMSAAVKGLESGDRKLDQINNAIIKAQDVITELMVSLDFDKGGEIANNLYSLYVFFNRQLMQANIQKDADMIRPVAQMMKELKETWVQVFQKAGMGASGISSGVNIAG